MNFDEFWVRVDLVKFDIQDRNKQRVLVYFRTLSVHIHIARVLQPAPCSMPLRSALLSSNCAKIGIRNANVFPEPGSEMVRDGQRWSEMVRGGQKQAPQSRKQIQCKEAISTKSFTCSGSTVVVCSSACLCDADQISTCRSTTIVKQIVCCGIDTWTFPLQE